MTSSLAAVLVVAVSAVLAGGGMAAAPQSISGGEEENGAAYPTPEQAATAGPQSIDAAKVAGTVHITKYDAGGNVVFADSESNALMATGADYILSQIFVNGTAPTADNLQVGSLCVSNGSITVAETVTASAFDSDNTITDDNCKQDDTVTFSGQVATIGPLVFDAGDTNFADDTTIKAVGICTAQSANNTAYNDCGLNSGILFAQVDLANDITVGSGETLAITYTFDMLP
jgi:hypothetical protein